MTEGEAASEALYYGIASRLAMLLDLPSMPVLTRLEQEINVRSKSCFDRHMYWLPLTDLSSMVDA